MSAIYIVIVIICLGICIWLSIKKAKQKYNNEFVNVQKDINGKVYANKKLELRPLYRYVFISCILIAIALVFIIEGVFRSPIIQNCYSSFDADVTIQVIVGIIGALATSILGVITIIYSKSESYYNEQLLLLVQEQKNQNQEKIKKELEEHIEAITTELQQKERERKEEIKKKEKQQILQTIHEYFNGLNINSAYLVEIGIQWNNNVDMFLYPAISRFVDRDKSELCLILFSRERLPVYIDILLQKVTMSFNDGSKCSLCFENKNDQYNIGLDAISIYFPYNNTEGFENLFLFWKRKYDCTYEKCKCELELQIKDKYIVQEESIQDSLLVSFELVQCYDENDGYLSEFSIKNVEIK